VSALAATLAVVVSGCGGGSGESGPTKTETSSRTTPPDTPAVDGREPTVRLNVALAPSERGVDAKYSDAVTAKPGDSLLIRTQVTPGVLDAPVNVSIEKQAGEEIKITASAGSLSAVARVKSASSTPVKLVAVRFNCLIATDSLCPPSRTAETGEAFEYETAAERAQRRGPIVIVAKVAGG
jgi:hypothetical protein